MTVSMNLFLRNGIWYVRYERCRQFPRGKLRSLKTTDRSRAVEIMRILERRLHENRIAELDRSQRIGLADYIEWYVTHAERADLSPDTLRMDRLALKTLSDVVGGARSVKAIDHDDIGRLKTACLSRGNSPRTVRTYLRHIKAALNFAVANGYREALPRFPKVAAPENLPKVLTRQQLDRIMEWLRENDLETWRMAEFALWTGCRLSEIATLRWPSVVFHDEPRDGIVGVVTVTGKGSRQRNIPLLPMASVAVGTQRDIGPVFAPWHPDTISHRFARAAKRVGVQAKFHSLRHTAATWMIESGIRLEIVQRILGHSDIRTTQIYAKVFDKVVANEMRKMVTFDR